jgi:ubiquinone/menaquinone biosynthesis C-methylase UbiE
MRASLNVLACYVALGWTTTAATSAPWAAQPAERAAHRNSTRHVLTAAADERLRQPLEAIAAEYARRTGSRVHFDFAPAAKVQALASGRGVCDVIVSLATDADANTAVASLAGAKKVAWKYPSGEPVWAAVLAKARAANRPQADRFLRFLGGPTGHRLWSESEAGFTIASGRNRAEAYEWVVEHRIGHTYPMTAARMLRECGGIRQGICIDVGCGSGLLDVELAKRSQLTILGLDVDPDVEPLFDARMRRAGLQDRVSFVLGGAQALPFPDDYADVIVSRGTLVFIPDLGKCLREVDRVLKPTGVAFLGGRYLYTPQAHKMSTAELREIVRQAEIPGARVIEARGQWVKIVGAQAPKAAHGFQGGPEMLAGRIVADYAITEGQCLLICRADGALEQALQQAFVEITGLEVTALYPSDEVATGAERRIRAAGLAQRVRCEAGDVHALPFDDASFDVVAGVGPILLWGDRETAMCEIYRVLTEGGAALIGGRYLHMPDSRKVSTETLQQSADGTGIPSIRVYDDMGQWVEIRKGIKK